QQVARAARPEVVEGPPDEAEGEVDQTVAAEDRVGLGKRIASQVEHLEAPSRAAELRPVALDQRGDEVGADVEVEVQRRREDPVAVAAGSVEQGVDTQL